MSLLLALLVTGGGVGVLAQACGSSGGVGVGGTCFLLTDCSQSQGLFCLRPDGSDNGTCVGKGDLGEIQPPSAAKEAGSPPLMPVPDAAADEVEEAPDAAMTADAPASTLTDAQRDASAPHDGGTADVSPSDTGSSETSSATDG